MIPPLLSLLLVALLEFVVWERLVPPPVRPAQAPAEQFSAARAQQSLERLLGEGEPHPTGSAAQERVRARLLAELEHMGLKPDVQTGVACGPEGVCAEIGGEPQRIVLRDDAAGEALRESGRREEKESDERE